MSGSVVGPRDFLLAARDGSSAPVFAELARLAADSCGAPMGFVSLIDGNTQTFLGGHDWSFAYLQGAQLIGAECVRSGQPFWVADTHAVAELHHAQFVTGPPHVRWLAAVPLFGGGRVVGVIGALDRSPRSSLSGEELAALSQLSRLATLHVEAVRRPQPLPSSAQLREEVFRRIVETANEGVWLIAADTRTLYVNPRMSDICGRAPDEMVGRSFLDFVTEADQVEVGRHWSARQQGLAESYETRLFRPDGSSVPVLVTATPLFSDDGQFYASAVLVADVSELKQTEEALKRSEAELQRAQHMAHIGHWTWTPHPDSRTPWRGTSIYSPSGAAIFGVTPNELAIPSDEYVERFVHPDDRDLVSRTVLSHGGPSGNGYTLEYRIVRADGNTRVIREIAELVRDDNGRYLHSIGALQDVTEGRQAEAALRESEKRFRMIADTMPNLLWIADAQGHISFLNRRWEEYSGVPVSENLGRVWAIEAHPEDAAKLDDPFRSGLYPISTHEIRIRRRDGVYRWFLDTAAYRYGENGEFLGYVGTLTDIDDMKRLYEQLHQAQKMEAVGQLTGGIAHDFNNLLTVILGNAELLEERLKDESLARLATATRGAAERSAALVRRLLAFSRRQTLQPVRTDVCQLIEGMRELLDRTLGATIEVVISCDRQAPPVLVDRAQLESAMLNLAINARDAMPEGGRLSIETAAIDIDADDATEGDLSPGRYTTIAVSDSGIGMSDEVKRQAFEPFFTTKGIGQGSGLGLPMVYGFIKQSGGHVILYSEPGAGTTIKMYLRQAAEEEHAGAGEQPPHAALRGGTEKILIVEDEDRVLEYVVSQLCDLGYRVVTAGDGPRALTVLDAEGDVDLLFTDIVMPGGMNGRQLADAARQRKPGLKVLYTTGYTRDAIVQDGRLDPGVALLSKPYPRRELARKLREVLDSPSA